MRFAIIDESGRLFDPHDKFLVFAAIVVDSLVNLDKVIPSVKKHLPKKAKRKGKSLKESSKRSILLLPYKVFIT